MKTRITLILAVPLMVHADDWTGRDKALHLTGGAAISSAVMLATRDEATAFYAGCGIGLAKELADTQRKRHTPSLKDAAVTCAGAYIGTKTTTIMLTGNGFVARKAF